MALINRRQFHSGAALSVATASTASMVWTGCSDAANPTPSRSANEQLGVVICGLNGRGGEHIRGFHADPRTQIRAIVDIDAKVAQSRADRIEKMQGLRPAVFADVREALETDGIDILSCATPNHWHALMGVWAMQAGKDLYLEKPISHNIHEGRALVAAAETYGRIFQTGTQCRSSSGVVPAMQFLADGGIGEVRFARGLCYKRRKSIGPLGDYPIPAGVDFNLWSGPATYNDPRLTRQRFHYDWHWQRHYGNGDSGNQGPHQTDIARWGLGLDRHPQQILSYGGRLGYKAERNNPDYVDAGDTANTQVAIFDYGDKTVVFETRGLDCTDSADKEINELFGYTKGNKIGVIFYGSEGYLRQGPDYGTCVAFDKNKRPIREFKATSDIGDDHFGNFIDAVVSRDTSSLNADARCGHLSAAMAHLGNISYYLGQSNEASAEQIAAAVEQIPSRDEDVATLRRTVTHLRDNGVDLSATPMSVGPLLRFDPDAERFLDNESANALLTRQYRSGFEVPSAETIRGNAGQNSSASTVG